MVGAGSACWAVAWMERYAFPRRLIFQQGSGGNPRRRLRGLAIRGAKRGGTFSLVATGSDVGRAWLGRNEARPTNHGAAVRGIYGRLERAWRFAATYGCNTWRGHQHMDDIRALLSICLSRRPLQRTAARQRASNDRTLRDHRCRCRCSDEPRRLVWNAYCAAQERAVQLVRCGGRGDRFPRHVAMEMGHHSRDHCCRYSRSELQIPDRLQLTKSTPIPL